MFTRLFSKNTASKNIGKSAKVGKKLDTAQLAKVSGGRGAGRICRWKKN